VYSSNNNFVTWTVSVSCMTWNWAKTTRAWTDMIITSHKNDFIDVCILWIPLAQLPLSASVQKKINERAKRERLGKISCTVVAYSRASFSGVWSTTSSSSSSRWTWLVQTLAKALSSSTKQQSELTEGNMGLDQVDLWCGLVLVGFADGDMTTPNYERQCQLPVSYFYLPFSVRD